MHICTSLLIFSVQIFNEQTSWPISQTSITVLLCQQLVRTGGGKILQGDNNSLFCHYRFLERELLMCKSGSLEAGLMHLEVLSLLRVILGAQDKLVSQGHMVSGSSTSSAA